jgi:membrane fusion protein, multidrug efflux system
VKAGELLATIDPRPFQVQLLQAEGQLARDEALLQNAKIDLDRVRKSCTEDLLVALSVPPGGSRPRSSPGSPAP